MIASFPAAPKELDVLQDQPFTAFANYWFTGATALQHCDQGSYT